MIVKRIHSAFNLKPGFLLLSLLPHHYNKVAYFKGFDPKVETGWRCKLDPEFLKATPGFKL